MDRHANESNRHWELALDRPGSAGPAAIRYSAGFAAIIIAETVAGGLQARPSAGNPEMIEMR
jgi:hypothetical protein